MDGSLTSMQPITHTCPEQAAEAVRRIPIRETKAIPSMDDPVGPGESRSIGYNWLKAQGLSI
jgi:hypothetical protein